MATKVIFYFPYAMPIITIHSLQKIMTQYFFLLLLFTYSSLVPFTIMIDPSGDAKHTGRIIENTFERGITLQCAEALKKELNQQMPNIRVVLTRVPGETLQPLQNASFANRLQVDFYISIYFYPEPEIPSHVSLFEYQANTTDNWHKYNPLSFYHVSQAHLINIKKTIDIGKIFLKNFQNNFLKPFFIVQGLFCIPFKPLLGIKAPAIALEAGLVKKDDWKHLINPLVNSIKEIVS